MPREPQLKGPSEAWLREMAEKEDGKCTSVGGLAVKLGLYKKPEHPVPQPDPDGWIAWGGKGTPDGLSDSDEVEVKLRSTTGLPGIIDDVEAFCWDHMGSPADIVAYRLVQPAPEQTGWRW